eukprot:5946611-Alexandrium_andersonii.AAC.1
MRQTCDRTLAPQSCGDGEGRGDGGCRVGRSAFELSGSLMQDHVARIVVAGAIMVAVATMVATIAL